MGFYTRQQLVVLVALLATAGIGLAVGQWRHAHPGLVDRLERLDRGASVQGGPSASLTPLAGSEPSLRAPSARTRPPKLDGDADGGPARLDLNDATLDDLTRLPGVGAVLAARIVDAREVARFTSIDDLRRVRGLGPSKLDRLRPFLSVRASPSVPTPSPDSGSAADNAPSPTLAPTPGDDAPAVLDGATPGDG